MRVRRTILMPIIFTLCTVGAYASASRLFDVYTMVHRHRRLLPPGVATISRPLCSGWCWAACWTRACGEGSYSLTAVLPFFTRPISMGLAFVTLVTLLLYIPACRRLVRRAMSAVRVAG